MISVTDIKVAKTYIDGKYWKPAYEARLAIRLPETYSDQWIKLSEEKTAKVVDLILSLATEDLRFEHYVPSEPKPEPTRDDSLPYPPELIPADEMEPL